MHMFDRPVILDCDPGHDDALAIWLAAQHMDVRGIVTVHGNQSIEKVTRNALQIVEVAELDIPVYQGMGAPLVERAHPVPWMHGESGLDGPTLSPPTRAVQDLHGVDFLCEVAETCDDLVVIATGPLTNIAAALRRDPAFAARVFEISLMGGTTEIGNATPTAEFNIWADPEAAAVVFGSGVQIRMVGLNLTRQAEADAQRIAAMRALGTTVANVAADLVGFYAQRTFEVLGLAGASLHDPCAVAWLLDESLIESVDAHVDVELSGRFTRGMTVCDRRNVSVESGVSTFALSGQPNAKVGLKLDVDGFFDLLYSALRGYPAAKV